MRYAGTFSQLLAQMGEMGLLPDAVEHPHFAGFTEWKPIHRPPPQASKLQPRFGVVAEVNGTPYVVDDFCGVYLVAWFDKKPPSGRANPFRGDTLPRLAYVGRTRTNALGVRLDQLLQAVLGKKGHSGGNVLWAAAGRSIGSVTQTTLAEQVYVAALPVWISKARQSADLVADRRQTCFRTAAIEAILIDAISERRGHRPIANDASLLHDAGSFRFDTAPRAPAIP